MEIPESISKKITFNDFIIPLKDTQIQIPDIGPAVLLDVINESLFSNKEIDFPRLELLKNGFTLRYNNKVYFITSEINRYIEFLTKNNFKIDKISDICPINFHILNKQLTNQTNVYIHIYEKLFKLREFIINNSLNLLNFYWPSFFKGEVTSFIKNPMMMVLRFKRPTGKSLILNIIDIDNRIILLSQDKVSQFLEKGQEERLKINECELIKDVVNNWNDVINMDDEKQFIINNLSNVIGSIDMAKFIFESNKVKKEYIIDINHINSLVNFSSNKSKKEYIEYFCSKYKKLFILSSQNTILLNFEGFNKYLLNLNPLHLKSFNDKEQINEMYYSITNALVECYEKLYYFQKI